MSKEDIEILEEFIEEYKNKGYYGIIKVEKIQAFANILLDYKQKLEENEANKKRINELEVENKKNSISIICLQEELEDSIPKAKVKEIIQKLDVDIERNKRREISHIVEQDTNIYSNTLIAYDPETIKRILEELLKDGGE